MGVLEPEQEVEQSTPADKSAPQHSGEQRAQRAEQDAQQQQRRSEAKAAAARTDAQAQRADAAADAQVAGNKQEQADQHQPPAATGAAAREQQRQPHSSTERDGAARTTASPATPCGKAARGTSERPQGQAQGDNLADAAQHEQIMQEPDCMTEMRELAPSASAKAQVSASGHVAPPPQGSADKGPGSKAVAEARAKSSLPLRQERDPPRGVLPDLSRVLAMDLAGQVGPEYSVQQSCGASAGTADLLAAANGQQGSQQAPASGSVRVPAKPAKASARDASSMGAPLRQATDSARAASQSGHTVSGRGSGTPQRTAEAADASAQATATRLNAVSNSQSPAGDSAPADGRQQGGGGSSTGNDATMHAAGFVPQHLQVHTQQGPACAAGQAAVGSTQAQAFQAGNSTSMNVLSLSATGPGPAQMQDDAAQGAAARHCDPPRNPSADQAEAADVHPGQRNNTVPEPETKRQKHD